MKVDEYRESVLATLENLRVTNEAQTEDIAEIKVNVKEQNGRLRSVEQDLSKAKGVGVAVSALFASVLGWVGLK